MPFTTNSTISKSNGHDISKLLTAAIVNAKFCKLLLNDPAKALANGYNGEIFRLSKDEFDQILSIKANSISDFAKQLVENRNTTHVLQPVPVRAELRVYASVGLD